MTSDQKIEDQKYWNNKWEDKETTYQTGFAQEAYKIISKNNLNSILDLGCGSGGDSIYFQKMGLVVTAIDRSEVAIKKLKSESNKVNAIKIDIADLDFPNNSFDVVYSHLSLHYFNDETTSDIFNRIYRILKPNGYFFVKCRSVKDKRYGQGNEMEKNVFFSEHIRHFFTENYMDKKLKSFEVVSIKDIQSSENGFIEAIAKKN